MADEEFEVKIEDGISPQIPKKLKDIELKALRAEAAVNRLKASQNSLGVSANKLYQSQYKTAASMYTARDAVLKNEIAYNRLKQAQNATFLSNKRAEIASIRLANAKRRETSSIRSAAGALYFWHRMATVAAAGGFGFAIIGLADSYTVLRNKLQLVSTSQGQVIELQERLFDIANRTRSGVEETTTSFARFDRALGRLGKSHEDSLRLTETVNKALIISGATTAEQSSALLQLSQAFNAGRLNGDEFRAVSENIPIVLEAIAKATGKPIHQLKDMSAKGLITSKVMFDAFKLIEEQVDETFAKTIPTAGQALTVLRNKTIKFLGELNTQYGITQKLSKAILYLANNLDKVAAAAAASGGMIAAYYSNSLVTSIMKVTGSVAKLNLALLASPVGLLVAGLTAAGAAAYFFGDQITITSDKTVTFQHLAMAVFGSIQEGAILVAHDVGSAWGAAIDFANKYTDGWAEQFRSASKFIVRQLDSTIDKWINRFNILVTVWSNLPGVFASIGKLALMALKKVANFATDYLTQPFQHLSKVTRLASPKIADQIDEALSSVKEPFKEGSWDNYNFMMEGVELVDKIGAAAKQLKEAHDAKHKTIEQFVDAARVTAEMDKYQPSKLRGELRPEGIPMDIPPPKKKGKKRWDVYEFFRKENFKLDNENARMFMVPEEREAQKELDRVRETLAKHKLNKEETAFAKAAIVLLEEKIKRTKEAARVQEQFDRIYKNATEPMKEYERTLEAISILKKQMVDSGVLDLNMQEQLNREMVIANENIQNHLNPLRQWYKAKDEELELLKKFPREREVENELTQLKNELLEKGIKLDNIAIAQLKEKLKLLQEQNELSQAEDSLQANSMFEKNRAFYTNMGAQANLRFAPGSNFNEHDTYFALKETDIGEYLDMNAEMFAAEAAMREQHYRHIEYLREQNLISERTAKNAEYRIWKEGQDKKLGVASQFFDSLEGLQRIKSKEMFAIGKAAAIANATINTYQAATGAWASLSAIPVVGPALAGASAAAIIATGLANVARIANESPGFKLGGYTGNMPTDSVAGVVHGREYVLDAASTARLGKANLDALRAGAASIQRRADVSSEVSSSRVSSNQPVGNTELKLRLINAIDQELINEYVNSAEGEKAVINVMKRNSDTVKRIVR